MDVHLTPELEQLVQDKVESGRYNSASEVVREALRLMEERDQLRSAQLRQLRDRIDKGIEEAGDGAEGEIFMQELLDDLDTLAAQRNAG